MNGGSTGGQIRTPQDATLHLQHLYDTFVKVFSRHKRMACIGCRVPHMLCPSGTVQQLAGKSRPMSDDVGAGSTRGQGPCVIE